MKYYNLDTGTMTRLLLVFLSLVFVQSAAAEPFSLDDYIPEHPLADNSTYGNIEEIATTHLHLDVTMEFDRRVIDGTVTHDLDVVADTRVL